MGTSGFSYTEWCAGGFYPEGTQPSQMLPFYAQRFSATELNQTWHQMPRSETLERLGQQVPPGFLFIARLSRKLTHEVDAQAWQAHAGQFRAALAPLLQTRQLAAVLLDFPESFERSAANRRYLARLLDLLAGLPLAIEFRHLTWAQERVWAELERRKVTLALLDGPQQAASPLRYAVTNPAFFYVRFLGRAAAPGAPRQSRQLANYCYREDELQAWAERRLAPLAAQARQGFLIFCNHGLAHAAHNALTMTLKVIGRGGFSTVAARAGP